MSTVPSLFGPFPGMSPMIKEDIQKLKNASLWFILLGAALIILGMLAIGYSTLFTIASVEIFGVFLVIGGLFYLGGSFFTGSWGGFLNVAERLSAACRWRELFRASGRGSHRLHPYDGNIFHGWRPVPHRGRPGRPVQPPRLGSTQRRNHSHPRYHDLATDALLGSLGDRYVPGHRSDFQWLDLFLSWAERS